MKKRADAPKAVPEAPGKAPGKAPARLLQALPLRAGAERLLDIMSRHPFFCSFLVCFLLAPFCYGAEAYITGETVFTIAVFLITLTVILAYGACQKRAKRPVALAAAGMILLIAACAKMISVQDSKARWIMAAFLLVSFCLAKRCSLDGLQPDTRRRLAALSILVPSFVVKFCYVLRTSIYRRQHDVSQFGKGRGHCGVIEYYLTNKQLPDFDVRRSQFYHPPLHHMISAAWLDFLENFCGVTPDLAQESIQMLTLFYSTACAIIAYKVLRHFGCKGISLYLPLAIFAFHPQYIIFSASINNDILATTLVLAAILCTLKWYQSRDLFGILKIALAVGLAMMTKLSAALVAPPIAMVFLVVLVQGGREQLKTRIAQYAAFGAVCCPLGLWWGIRNYLLYDVPITYIPRLSETSDQYVGNIPFWQRVTDFSPKLFESVFENWVGRDGFSGYNPTVSILKTSIFGEWVEASAFNKLTELIPVILFWTAALLAAGSVVFMIVAMVIFVSRTLSGKQWIDPLFLTVFHVLLLGSYYRFCCTFPHTCTQDFRYIAASVLVGVVFLGLPLAKAQRNPGSKPWKLFSAVLTGLTAVFCLCSSLIYGCII